MSSFRSILCPVDFSPLSERAFRYAVRLAGRAGGMVHIVHAAAPPVASVPPHVPLPGVERVPSFEETVIGQSVGLAEKQLDQWKSWAMGIGVDVSVRVETGDIHGVLQSSEDSFRPDLVVMGTHGRSRLERLFLGSTAEKTSRSSNVPVLTIPDSDDTFREPPNGQSLLVATDLATGTRAMIGQSVRLAGDLSAEIRLLHVVARPPQARAALARLMELIDIYANRWGDGRPKLIPEVEIGTPHEGILKVAARSRSDVITLCARPRGMLSRGIFGATLERVLRDSSCPVLAVPDSPDVGDA